MEGPAEGTSYKISAGQCFWCRPQKLQQSNSSWRGGPDRVKGKSSWSTKMFRFDKDKVEYTVKFQCLIWRYHSQIFQLCFCETVLNRPLRHTEAVSKHFCPNIKCHRFSFLLNSESKRFNKSFSGVASRRRRDPQPQREFMARQGAKPPKGY